MFEESFMEAFPGDLNVRPPSCSNHRGFRDLSSGDFPSSSVSGGLFLPDVRTTPVTPILHPFMNDQSYLHHLKLNASGRNQMVGGDLSLCQNLSRLNLSDDRHSVLAQLDPFRVDPDVFESSALDRISEFERSMSRQNGFHNVFPGWDGSLYPPNGVSLDGLAVDCADEKSRLLGFQYHPNPEGLNEIMARNRREFLLRRRNGSSQQSLPNRSTRSRFTEIPMILQRLELESQVNDVSLKLGANMVFQSLTSSTMEGRSIELGASSLEDGSIIQGSNVKFSAQCNNNGSTNEMDSYLKDDQLKQSGDDAEYQGSVPSLASMVGFYGSINLMAKDQIGCRFLQRMFDQGPFLDVTMIFHEVINHLIELTIDPFGNYFIQKLLDVCTEEQRTQIVIMMTSKPGQLIKISLNTYGTRVVQKLIETLRTKQQIALVTSALKQGFLSLVRDLNGNHVIQRCLHSLGPDDNKFVFEAATKFCVEIATHRHGCCVLQRCISFAAGPQRNMLIAEISRNSLLLAQDPFGNYAVQYIIEQKVPVAYVLCQLREHYVQLSMQKFSSHVVEKCLRHFPESRSQIVRELISVDNFEQLLQDPYANYVIQSALSVTKGALKASLVEKVRPFSNLRTSPYCKRIFSRSLSKK